MQCCAWLMLVTQKPSRVQRKSPPKCYSMQPAMRQDRAGLGCCSAARLATSHDLTALIYTAGFSPAGAWEALSLELVFEPSPLLPSGAASNTAFCRLERFGLLGRPLLRKAVQTGCKPPSGLHQRYLCQELWGHPNPTGAHVLKSRDVPGICGFFQYLRDLEGSCPDRLQAPPRACTSDTCADCTEMHARG